MAEYSKQFVERQFMDEQFGWDFDIEELAIGLNEKYMIPVICEGYGFIGILKLDGKIQLIFSDDDSEDGAELVPYDDLDRRFEERSLPSQKEK